MPNNNWKWTDDYEGSKFKVVREEKGWKQIGIDGLSDRTVRAIESNDSSLASFDSVKNYAGKLDLPLDYFRRYVPDPRVNAELVKICLRAVFAAYLAAWRTILRPWEFTKVRTALGKIARDLPLELDPTEAVDYTSSQAMRKIIQSFASSNGHPLSKGIILVDEERGAEMLPDVAQSWRYIVQIDSCDDTVQLLRLLGGSILCSIYESGVGVVAAAACDFIKGNFYTRGAQGYTQAIRLSQTPARLMETENFLSEPEGNLFTPSPSNKTTLANATLNIYLGHAHRIGYVADHGGSLRNRADINVVSNGGSRGPLLVIDTDPIDASVELRGFKLLDSLPGLYVAAGTRAIVTDLDGHPLRFGPDIDLERIFSRPASEWSKALNDYRIRFIVAATEALANEIGSVLGTHNDKKGKPVAAR